MITMFIDGVEVVCSKEFNITEELLNTSSTILNNCFPKSWDEDKDYTSRFFFPKDYSKCTIYKNDSLIFAGIVKNTSNISLRPTDPKYGAFQILDFKTLLSEGLTLDFVIANKTITEAIIQIIEAVASYGFIVGNIDINNADEIIGAYSTLNKTPYDVFQYLAEISQSKWCTRLIDENTVAVDFYAPERMEVAAPILYTEQYFEENEIVDIVWNYGTRDYRNRQIILSDAVYGNIDFTDNIISDGVQTSFTTSQTIGVLKEISIDGVLKTFATVSDSKLGIIADFYYTPGNSDLESEYSVPLNSQIKAIYTPIVKGRQVVSDTNEIERITNQMGRNGVISRYETRNDVLSSNELQAIAQTYIKFKGMAEINLTVTTKDKDLFKVGQQVFFDMPQVEQLNANYMVKSKVLQINQTGEEQVIFYKYALTNNFNSETAINYFDNQRRKATGNIDQDQFITRNIDINNNFNIIFKDLVITEIEVSNSNIIEAVLNAPFND